MLPILLAACVIDRGHYETISDEIASGDRDHDGYADASEGGDDCDDLDAAIHPGADENWENGVTDNDCDGERESIEVEFGSHALLGESADANAGRRLGVVSDLDGNGLDELLIGAYTDGTRYAQGGAVYLVMDSREGPLSVHPALRPMGAGWYLGSALHGGPDVDDDGLPDLVVGALGFEDAAGVAWLVSGSDLAEGSVDLPAASIGSIVGPGPGAVAGAAVRFLGDVTGDGLADLAVSAQLAGNGEDVNAGLVGIWTATEVGDAHLEDAPIAIYGPYADAIIGATIAGAGDQDGDGLDDYLISSDRGLLASILPGGVASPGIEADAIFRLTASGAAPEAAEVRMIGDIDGDGAEDLAVVPLTIDERSLPAEVLLYTALAANPTLTTGAPSAVIHVGEGSYVFDVADPGDLDGDGRAEVLIPAQFYSPLGTSVFAIHFGDTLGYNADVDLLDSSLVGISVRTTAALGYRALVASDLDGDGYGDLALGGYADDEAAENAGAVVVIGLPH